MSAAPTPPTSSPSLTHSNSLPELQPDWPLCKKHGIDLSVQVTLLLKTPGPSTTPGQSLSQELATGPVWCCVSFPSQAWRPSQRRTS